MTELLIKLFVKNSKDTKDVKVRLAWLSGLNRWHFVQCIVVCWEISDWNDIWFYRDRSRCDKQFK